MSTTKQKQAHMAERREKAMQVMKDHDGITINALSKLMGIDHITLTHTIKILIYGGAVKKDGHTYVPNIHNKQTKVCQYKLTGKPFDLEMARNKSHEKHAPKPEEPEEPGVRKVRLMDKPCRRNQEGQGSGHHRVFIGSGRGW